MPALAAKVLFRVAHMMLLLKTDRMLAFKLVAYSFGSPILQAW